ncbi:hypothetical protein LCGC14_2163600, partial [marine sediment metagenome]
MMELICHIDCIDWHKMGLRKIIKIYFIIFIIYNKMAIYNLFRPSSKRAGYDIFAKSLNAETLDIEDLQVDNDMKYAQGSGTGGVYKRKLTFSYNPSTDTDIFPRYIGQFRLQDVVEFVITDSGSSHNSASHFKVVRKNADTPIVEVFSGLDQMLNSGQHYEIYAFLVDSASYQLYYLDVTTQNSTIFFNVYVNAFDTYLDTGGQVSDAGMVECQYSMYMYNHDTSPPNISVNFGKKPDDRTMQIDTLGNIRSGANSLATTSNIPKALSYILVEQGQQVYASGVVTPQISITGLTGDSDVYYKLMYDYDITLSDFNQQINVRFNNDSATNQAGHIYSTSVSGVGTNVITY